MNHDDYIGKIRTLYTAEMYADTVGAIGPTLIERVMPVPRANLPTKVKIAPDVLQMNTAAFDQWCQAHRSDLDYDDEDWLSEWTKWQSSNNFLPDDEMRLIRYGHYVGWMKGSGA